jgi:hypothetical protein
MACSTYPLPTSRVTRRRLAGGAAFLGLAGLAASSIIADAPHPDAELIALCHQFDELERAYQKIYDDPDATEDEEEAARLAQPIVARRAVLLPQVIALRATTFEGLMTRARTVYLEDVQIGREAVEVLEGSPYMNELLMAALHRDLMAMAGVSVIPFRKAVA